jgi:hypothetical protein
MIALNILQNKNICKQFFFDIYVYYNKYRLSTIKFKICHYNYNEYFMIKFNLISLSRFKR